MKTVTLTIMNGPNQGEAVTANLGEELIIGRATSSNFAIMDPRMSRLHFQVDSKRDAWRLRDLGSSNGTLLNDEKVDETTIDDGDVIRAGDTGFRVTFSDDELRTEESATAPEPRQESAASSKRTWTD